MLGEKKKKPVVLKSNLCIVRVLRSPRTLAHIKYVFTRTRTYVFIRTRTRSTLRVWYRRGADKMGNEKKKKLFLIYAPALTLCARDLSSAAAGAEAAALDGRSSRPLIASSSRSSSSAAMYLVIIQLNTRTYVCRSRAACDARAAVRPSPSRGSCCSRRSS